MIDPRDFVDAAADSLELGESADGHEAHIRTAIGRAYYAAYHAARALAEENRLPKSSRGGSHERLIRTFTGNCDKKWKRMGNQLQQMKQFRTRADYDLHSTLTARDARLTLRQASEVLNHLYNDQQASASAGKRQKSG